MKDQRKGHGWLTFFSVLYILAALCMLLGVCSFCYPQFCEHVLQVVGGMEDSPVREAFGTLADGLEAGLPVKETVAASVEVLLGDVF